MDQGARIPMSTLALLLLLSSAGARTGVGLPGNLRVGDVLPEFPSAEGSWLWSPKPQTLQDPDGRFGVLFVWRQGLYEARESLIWLSDLAKRRPEIRVFSVHAPRYDWERDLGSLAKIQDFEALSVPVLWDVHRAYWRAAGFKSYPTVVLIDPFGKVLWFHEGLMKKKARPGELLERTYEKALEEFLRGLLNGPEAPLGGVLAPALD